MDWRTTGRANLHVADKAECWIPQRESSRNYPGSGQEQVCLETGLKSKQKSCTKGLLAARGQLVPPLKILSIGSFVGITAEPGNWSVPELSFSSQSLHLGLPADSCWGGTHSPHVFSSPFKIQQSPGCQGTDDKVTTCWRETMEINPCLSKVHMPTHKHSINIKRKIKELNMGEKNIPKQCEQGLCGHLQGGIEPSPTSGIHSLSYPSGNNLLPGPQTLVRTWLPAGGKVWSQETLGSGLTLQMQPVPPWHCPVEWLLIPLIQPGLFGVCPTITALPGDLPDPSNMSS